MPIITFSVNASNAVIQPIIEMAFN